MAAEKATDLMTLRKPSDKKFKEMNKDLKKVRRTLGEGGINPDSGAWRLANRMKGSPKSVENWCSLFERLIDYTRFRYRTKPWSNAELRVMEGIKNKNHVETAVALDRAFGHEYRAVNKGKVEVIRGFQPRPPG